MRFLRLTFIMLLAAGAAAQEPPRHDKYKDDALAYCWNPKSSGSQVARRQRDPHAHQCACHLICRLDPSGAVIGDQEDARCELYCTRQRCTCHVEEPCEKRGH